MRSFRSRVHSRTVPSSEAEASRLAVGREGDVLDRAVVLEEAWSGGGVGRGQVPEPDRPEWAVRVAAVFGGGGKHLAVRREGDVLDPAVVLEEAWSGGGVGRGQVPEPDRPDGAGGERLAVGREGDVVDRAVVLEEAWSGGGVGRSQVPEPDRSVLGDGGERLAVGREGDVLPWYRRSSY